MRAVLEYSLAEMVNNAIDGSASVTVEMTGPEPVIAQQPLQMAMQSRHRHPAMSSQFA